ncbi:LPXTG cell wall anchor domain-containing protein [Listeria sp. PSOL-1]|uniref:LPXTG cell wall anchor domain-containing protein n=1 Tax=Listeria sp. PSOL-1 TaxID=1844999 RepID=UPI0013D20013|nr:LPXTG cell wall anchor domain-containing protein [Listeria sp. PSOL-1]
MTETNTTIKLNPNPNPIVENGDLTEVATQKIVLTPSEARLPKTGDQSLPPAFIVSIGFLCILAVVLRKIGAKLMN